MKKIFVIFLVTVVVFYMSAFTVSSNQVGVVINRISNRITTYNTGVHFIIPLLEVVNFVELGNKTDSYSKNIVQINTNNPNSESTMVTYLINWHVTTPTTYYTFKQNNTETGVISQIKNYIDKQNPESIFDKPVLLNSIGVSIDKIQLIGITKTGDNKRALTDESSQTDDASLQVIESAYYEANEIITQTEIEKAKIYNMLDKSDIKFYNYWRTLDAYKSNALYQKEIPPFKRLYSE